MTGGTRFRLFPQYAAGYTEPEVIVLSSIKGTVGPGPSDRRMFAINPVDKRVHYDPPAYVPPYLGPQWPPALPNVGGHFDTIPTEAPEFLPAHLFGCARHVLDVWERYLSREIIWWHADAYPRLELIPVVDWANAHSGPGFIEMGLQPNRLGELQPFCLNLDVIAHEVGHAILFSEIGVPSPDNISGEFLAFHECFSDLVALVAALQFDSVVDRLLLQTDGNLYVLNLVSRIGEISDLEQIRIADNVVTMADVAGLELTPTGEWLDPSGANRNAHHLAEPLTGAIFDALVDIYQDGLVARGAIPPSLDARQWTPEETEKALAWVHGASAQAFAAFADVFRASLLEARDIVASSLAEVMRTLAAEDLSFERVAARFVEACLARGQAHQQDTLIEDFLWRGIDPRPAWLTEPATDLSVWSRLPYAEKARRVAAARERKHRCRAPEAFFQARRLMPHTHRSEAQ